MALERYRQSTREPPVYSVEMERPTEYVDYRQSRARDYRRRSISEDSRDREVYTVEDPPDGGTWAWLVVLACGVLHVCSEMVQILFHNTIIIATLRNPRLAFANATVVDTYTEHMVFEDVVYTGEIIAAFGAVLIGYRGTAVFGCLCTLGGFLGASWLDPTDDTEAMNFLVGFLGGIGVSFWRYTAYVAVMEYFTNLRMVAIALSGLGRAVGIFIGYGVLATPLKTIMDGNIDDVKSMTEWWVYYRSMVSIPVAAAVCCLIIKPLPSAAPQTRTSMCESAFKLHDTYLCRGFILTFTLAVYFIYYFGATLPMTSMVLWMVSERYISRHILGALFTYASGVLVGFVLLGFWKKDTKFYRSMCWMGVFALFMGALTIQVPLYGDAYLAYLAGYVGVLGITQVLFESVLRYAIPIGFGRTHIRWIEGLLGLTAGLATICNNFIARELQKEKPEYLGNIFYLAAAAFLAAGFLAVIVMNVATCTGFKDENREKMTPMPPKEPPVIRQSRREYNYDRDPTYARWRDQTPPRYYQYR